MKITKNKKYYFTFISLFIFYGFIELTAYFAIHTFVDQNTSKEDTNKSSKTYDTGWAVLQPHPYFGFIYKHHTKYYITAEYKTYVEGAYNIGIFGGSVAENFGNYLLKESIKNKLKEDIVSLKNKKLNLFVYAVGAHKQPQAFNMFHFYADNLDMAINIEGWNEIQPRTQHEQVGGDKFDLSIDGALPAFTEFLFKNDQGKLVLLGEYKFLVNIINKLRNNHFLIFHNFSHLLGEFLNHYVKSKYSKILNEISAFSRKKDQRGLSLEGAKPRVKLWKRYAEFQHIISREKKIQSFTFIQPNMHVRDTKIIHADEQKNFTKHLEAYSTYSYRLIDQEVNHLQQKGYRIFNLQNIFKNNDDLIYVDQEHVNDRGNEIILEEIIKTLNREISK